MPRRIVKQFAKLIHARRHKWYLSMFGERLTDTRLWSLNRHSITAAFGVGIGVSFVPLPVHLMLVVLAAIIWRLNVAGRHRRLLHRQSIHHGAGCITSPTASAPGCCATARGISSSTRTGTGSSMAWAPPGSRSCSVAWYAASCCGLAGRYALELIWRTGDLHRYHMRQERRRAA